jgi:hypothetical protein
MGDVIGLAVLLMLAIALPIAAYKSGLPIDG